MAWTDERIALLTQYWQEGRSASQIAEALGEGLTRNAVIGKAHRLGLAQRPSPVKAAEGKPPARSARPAPKAAAEAAEPVAPAPAPPASRPAPVAADAPRPVPAAAAAPAVAPPASAAPARKAEPRGGKTARVTLLDLNDRICKWPIGHPDEPDFHFCGKPVNAGFPYCTDHCLVAYQSQLQRRDRPAGPPPPFRPNLPRPR